MRQAQFDRFRDEVQEVLSCICAGELTIEDFEDGGREGVTLSFVSPPKLAAMKLPSGTTLTVAFVAIGLPPDAEPDAEGFAIVEQLVFVRDRNGRDLLTWAFGPNTGYLSVSGTMRGGVPLDSIKLPTGFVPIDEIAYLLIDRFGVRPLREDWATIIDPYGNGDDESEDADPR